MLAPRQEAGWIVYPLNNFRSLEVAGRPGTIFVVGQKRWVYIKGMVWIVAKGDRRSVALCIWDRHALGSMMRSVCIASSYGRRFGSASGTQSGYC